MSEGGAGTERRIPGFRILKLLGRGGMGEVWLAEQASLGRKVALKLLRGDKADEKAQARFLREAKVMARVKHPNLLGLLESGTEGNDLWLALELIDGQSLDRLLYVNGAFEPAQARSAMLQVAHALGALHDQKVLHRDIKPGNIMLERSGRIVLMDLGLAQSPDMTQLTRTGMVLGTPVYLAPEMFTGSGWDASVDWYAWAMTWWELLTASRPFETSDLIRLIGEKQRFQLPVLKPARGEIPAEERRVLERCLGPRKGRPSRLGEILSGLGGEGGPSGPGSSTQELPTSGVPGAGDASESMGTLAGTRIDSPSSFPPAPLVPVWMRWVGVGVGLLLVGLAVRKLGGVPGEVAGLPPTPAPVGGMRVVRELRDLRNLVVELEGIPERDPFLAFARLGDARHPVPVYDLGEGRALAWMAGLEPETRGSLVLDAGGVPVERSLPEYRLDRAPARPDYPELLAGFLGGEEDPDHRAGLDEVLAAVDPGHVFRDEADPMLLRHSGILASPPDRWWSSLIAILRSGGNGTSNLCRMIRWDKSPIPPAIAWQLLHLAAGPDSPRTMKRRAAGVPDLEITRGVRFPAAALRLLERWEADPPGDRAAVYDAFRQVVEGFLRPKGWSGFPFRVPGWQIPEGGAGAGARPAVSELPGAGLVADLVRTAGKALDHGPSRKALVERAARPGAEGRFATVLLGLVDDRASIRSLMDRYGSTRDPAEAVAVEAALEALRTPPGFFTASADEFLLRYQILDYVPVSVEGPPGVRLVLRPERSLLFGLYPGKTRIRMRSASGEIRHYRVSLDRGHVQVPPGQQDEEE